MQTYRVWEGTVSVLFNEPKLLKFAGAGAEGYNEMVSVLFNEPKLLKSNPTKPRFASVTSFSALQRAEIAEIVNRIVACTISSGVSVLFNEPKLLKCRGESVCGGISQVSVLFNEPKLLKFIELLAGLVVQFEFQCSSTSRNC